MKITRFYTTDNGESRFVDLDIPTEHSRKDAEGNILRLSNAYTSPNVCFVELPDGLVQSWHNAPARQIVVILSGELEVGTTDGQTRRGQAGDVFLASDVTGKGHTTRTIGGPARVMFAPLPDNFNIERWSAA